MLTRITLLPLPNAKVKRKTVLKVNNLQEIFPKGSKELSGETKQNQRQKVKKAEPIGYWIVSINMSTICKLKRSRDLFPFKESNLPLLFCNQQ